MQTTSGRIQFNQPTQPVENEEQTTSSGRIKFDPSLKTNFEEKYNSNTGTLNELKAKYSVSEPKKEGGFLSNVWKDLKYRGSELKETATDFKEGKISGAEVGLRVAGDIAGGVGDVMGRGLIATAKILTPKAVENKLGDLGKEFLKSETGQNLVNTISQGAEAYGAWKEKHPRLAENVESIANITSLIPIGKGTQVAGQGVKKVAGEAVETVAEKAVKTVSKAKGLAQKIAPIDTTLEATKKVIQGAPEDLAKGVKALSQLDTKGVKTFKDLASKIDEKIPTLLKQVDDDLAQDATEYALKDLTVKQISKSGKEVVTDYVTQGLKGLREMYDKIGDNLAKADIDDLIEKATKTGLTRKEVNDLARRYGSEFGSKAFSKTGEPLTSVNARLFENVRSGLKDVARAGIKGQAAKQADEMVSALIKTKDLVTKTANAVNKLQSKIAKRGLLEKIGHGAAKALDTLSGGSIRGVVGGLLPRGAGYKVMNALDLEEQLPKYLEIIQKAIKSESDDEIIDILKQIKLPKATGKEIAETVVENVPKTTVKSVTKKLPKGKAVIKK